ncbi:MAG: restriction endonuclease [Methylotenera sp.]|nr:restriction endonuclease [Methylotenera sp.]
MAIPDFQTLMLPTLKALDDGYEHPFKDVVEVLANEFKLTQEELSEMLPSRRARTFYNRVAWAKFYLKKAGLVSQTKRSYLSITKLGLETIKSELNSISVKFLEQFPDYIKFKEADDLTEVSSLAQPSESVIKNTPEEVLEENYTKLNLALAIDLLDIVKSSSPTFFERLVVNLLVRMGYGGTLANAARVTKRSGDEGIDGVIDEDRLGLDSIYIQAKRWEGVVGRPEIQKFVGALSGQRATKGVFITTSDFTKEALDFVKNNNHYKVVLINGYTLAKLMIENNVGVSVATTYEVKGIDSDFFVDE